MSLVAREIGTEYLDALAAATEARRAFETNGGDKYDPSGDTKKRVTTEYGIAVLRLANATRALLGLVPP